MPPTVCWCGVVWWQHKYMWTVSLLLTSEVDLLHMYACRCVTHCSCALVNLLNCKQSEVNIRIFSLIFRKKSVKHRNEDSFDIDEEISRNTRTQKKKVYYSRRLHDSLYVFGWCYCNRRLLSWLYFWGRVKTIKHDLDQIYF